jgi:hypothetical protein
MLRPVLLVLSLTLAAGFTVLPGTHLSVPRQAHGILINRRPMEAVFESRHRPALLRMSLDPAAVQALVDRANAATGSESAPTKVAKTVKKPTGALTVSVEYTNPEGLGEENGVEFRTLSAVLRRDGATSIFVDVSTDRGMRDLAHFSKEQVRTRYSDHELTHTLNLMTQSYHVPERIPSRFCLISLASRLILARSLLPAL